MAGRLESLPLYAPYSQAVLRIMTGLVFMQHGMQKLFMFPPSPHHPDPIPLLSLFGFGGILEFFGGLLFVIGLFTRSVGFLLSGQMAVAYFLFHFRAGLNMPNGLFPVVNEGDLAVILCFLFLHFVFAGPGAWSVDGLIARPNRAA